MVDSTCVPLRRCLSRPSNKSSRPACWEVCVGLPVDQTGKAGVLCRLFPVDFLNFLFRNCRLPRKNVLSCSRNPVHHIYFFYDRIVHSSLLKIIRETKYGIIVISWYSQGKMVHMHSWRDTKSMRLAYFTTDAIIMFPVMRYSTFKLVSFVSSV